MFEPADTDQPSNSEVVRGTHPLSAGALSPSAASPLGAASRRPKSHVDPTSAPSDRVTSASSFDIPGSGGGSSSASGSGTLGAAAGGGATTGAAPVGRTPSTSVSSPAESFVFCDSSGAVRRGNPHAPVAAGGSASDTVVSYARFRVSTARLGDEPLKPLTYFAIEATPGPAALQQADAPAPELPELPPAPYHALGGTLKRRCKWRAEVLQVDRRYSEFADFRELLTLLYPMLLIPPLPAKSQSENLSTYMGSPDSLRHQRQCLGSFCRALATIPELMLFCEWTPAFFQIPRGEQFIILMGRLREHLTTLRAAISPIFAFSDLEHHHSLVEHTGHVVKSVVSSVVGWFNGAGGGGGGGSKGELRAAIDNKVGEMVQFARHKEQIRLLTNARKAYEEAASNAHDWINLDEAVLQDMKDISAALSGYGLQALGTCEDFKHLSDVVLLEASFADDIAAAHGRQNANRVQVVEEALRHEADWAASVAAQLDFIICLWKRNCELAIGARGTREAEALAHFCAACNNRIEDEVAKYHERRKRRLETMQHRLVRFSLDFLLKEADVTSAHAMVSTMHAENFLTSHTKRRTQESQRE